MTATAALGEDRGIVDRIEGARLVLRPLTEVDVTPEYLDWLCDNEVNQYSRRYGKPRPSAEETRAWLNGLAKDEVALAIIEPRYGHIGNVKYGPINWSNLDADVAILIGNRAVWGQGLGAEALYLATRHLFCDRGLNRIHAASINPAFIRAVEKLGWQREGVQREEARVNGKFHDSVLLSILRREFKVIPAFEANNG